MNYAGGGSGLLCFRSEARSAYKANYNNPAIEISSLENLTAARLGGEIERDWHILSHYVNVTKSENVIEYVANDAMPIHNMDKEISVFDRAISTHAQRAEEHHCDLDEALAENVARGMDDKED